MTSKIVSTTIRMLLFLAGAMGLMLPIMPIFIYFVSAIVLAHIHVEPPTDIEMLKHFHRNHILFERLVLYGSKLPPMRSVTARFFYWRDGNIDLRHLMADIGVQSTRSTGSSIVFYYSNWSFGEYTWDKSFVIGAICQRKAVHSTDEYLRRHSTETFCVIRSITNDWCIQLCNIAD